MGVPGPPRSTPHLLQTCHLQGYHNLSISPWVSDPLILELCTKQTSGTVTRSPLYHAHLQGILHVNLSLHTGTPLTHLTDVWTVRRHRLYKAVVTPQWPAGSQGSEVRRDRVQRQFPQVTCPAPAAFARVTRSPGCPREALLADSPLVLEVGLTLQHSKLLNTV